MSKGCNSKANHGDEVKLDLKARNKEVKGRTGKARMSDERTDGPNLMKNWRK